MTSVTWLKVEINLIVQSSISSRPLLFSWFKALRGIFDNPSAFPFCCPLLCCTMKLYDWSIKLYQVNLGNLFNHVRARWSVCIINCLPNKYISKAIIPKKIARHSFSIVEYFFFSTISSTSSIC